MVHCAKDIIYVKREQQGARDTFLYHYVIDLMELGHGSVDNDDLRAAIQIGS